MKKRMNIIMPKTAETMEEGTILKWIKQEGDKVSKGDELVEIETEKAVVSVESPYDGTISKILVKNGETVPIMTEIALIEAEEEIVANEPVLDEKSSIQKSSSKEPVELSRHLGSETVEKEDYHVKASPAAKKLAKERGIDLTKIVGTGPEGRITREDVLATGTPVQKESLPNRNIPFSSMRKTIAKRLKESKERSPHFYITMTVDMSELIAWRDSNGKMIDEKENIHVTFNDIILAATARVLSTFREINVSCENEILIIQPEINIGLAIGTEDGLVVPVIRNADRKSIIQIARETTMFVKKAKEKKLAIEEISGGTFTISNLGMYNIDQFTAIINPPESAILAVGAIKKEPMVIQNTISIRDVIKLTLSSDHRVIDGVLAARFLNQMKHTLENPTEFLP